MTNPNERENPMDSNTAKSLKIVKLEADNYKRLRAIEITPDGEVVIIGGRNSQGKTSVLDSIWATLGGGPAAKGTKKPIRDGEDHARVMLDLGDLVVTRTWRGDTSALTVAGKDGSKYSSPQTVLDGFMGTLSFDPLEFTKLSPKDQVTALLKLVDLPIDLDETARQRAGIFDQRTEVGRTVKSLQGSLDQLGPIEDAPEIEVSQVEILAQYEEAHVKATIHAQKKAQLVQAEADLDRLAIQYSETEALIASLKKAVDVTLVDPEIFKADLASAEDTNAKVRRNKDRQATLANLNKMKLEYDTLTATLDKIDSDKTEALAQAVFPVEGLGFGEEGVTFNKIPFSQTSASEQIRVSLAMAMALNPKLRVIRILDGSLLDADNMKIIEDMAKDQGFQVWLERVGSGDGTGFIIEDGSVMSDHTQHAEGTI